MDLRRMVCTPKTLMLLSACIVLLFGAGAGLAEEAIPEAIANFDSSLDPLKNILSSSAVKGFFFATGVVGILMGIVRADSFSIVAGASFIFFPVMLLPMLNSTLFEEHESPAPAATVVDQAVDGAGAGEALIIMFGVAAGMFALFSYWRNRKHEQYLETLIDEYNESQSAEPAAVQELTSDTETAVTSGEPQVISVTERDGSVPAENQRPGRRKIVMD